MKKNKLFLIIFIFILIIQTTSSKKIDNKNISIEFKYDLDNNKGGMGLGGNGHLVHFYPVDNKISISEIEIYCSKSETYTSNPNLLILNSDYKMIYKNEIKNSLFKTKPQWINININKVIIENDFYVLFLTNSSKGNGIYVSYTDNKNENHSSQGSIKEKNIWQLDKLDINQTNWKIRVKGNLANLNAKITEPLIKDKIGSMEEAVQYLDTPEKLSEWMDMNFTYVSKYMMPVGDQTPSDTLQKRTGNCMDFAIFSFYILKQNNYNPLLFNIQLSNDSSKNHIITIFKKNGKLYKIDNTVLKGPFKDYEELARVHDENWWKYIIYDTIENAITKENPVTTVYK